MKIFLFLKAFLSNVIVLILVLFLSNCQDRDDIIKEDNHFASKIYKDKVDDYWNLLKKDSDGEQLSKLKNCQLQWI